MTLLVAIVSIIVLTQLAWLVKKQYHRNNQPVSPWLCPICLGVSLTWLGLLLAYAAGYSVDLTVVAIMMGGSTVGLSYKVKELWPPLRRVLWWRFLFVPAGFATVYFLIMHRWPEFLVAVLLALLLTVFMLRKEPVQVSKRVEKLEKIMDQCC